MSTKAAANAPTFAHVRAFVIESNRIEGILRDPTTSELSAQFTLWGLPSIARADVENFVLAVQPGALLRERVGMDVRVGNHIPPAGGPEVVEMLQGILNRAASGAWTPWEIHLDYEILHPFMDGNGRSGRAIWAWQMIHQDRGIPLGFLHQFYYQTLAARGERLP